jgi:hypothetical protein
MNWAWFDAFFCLFSLTNSFFRNAHPTFLQYPHISTRIYSFCLKFVWWGGQVLIFLKTKKSVQTVSSCVLLYKRSSILTVCLRSNWIRQIVILAMFPKNNNLCQAVLDFTWTCKSNRWAMQWHNNWSGSSKH